MRLGMKTVAVDPVLGPSVSPLTVNIRRFQPPAALLAHWPQPDVVLLSHPSSNCACSHPSLPIDV